MIFLVQFQGLLPILSQQDVIPQMFEHLPTGIQNYFLIVYQKDCSFSLQKFVRNLLFHLHLLSCRRYINLESRPLPLFRKQMNISTMRLYNTVSGGHPQAGSTAKAFCCKKRLENPFPGFPVHAYACVSDRQQDIVPWFHIMVVFAGHLFMRHIICFQKQVPAPLHGIRGIYIQIQQYLFHLALVRLNTVQFFRKILMNRNPFFRHPEGIRGFLNQLIQVDWLDFIPSFPGIPEELSRQFRSACNLLFDILKHLEVRMLGVGIQKHQRGISHNAHEQIIEIMSDTPG